MMDDFLTILGSIVLIAITVFILPFISFWLCYFGGWIASITIGNILTNGLNTLFQTTWFTKDMIPLCAGTLGWIGSYFKTKNFEKTKIKKESRG